jgi:cytochrome c biogenesis protein CcmG/thiol:disulfide interchange protein DsbE
VRRAYAALFALLVLAGCTAPGQEAITEPADDPFAGCAAIVSDQATSGLPDLTLPCFHGGMSVRLSQLTGPLVVNLWASWCPPCRQELPAFQKLAQRTSGKLTVLGVVTQDERDSAVSTAEDLGLTFPAVVDDDAKLGAALVKLRAATSALPVTLFVKDGRLVYAYQGKALDQASLDKLVDRYLGVPA